MGRKLFSSRITLIFMAALSFYLGFSTKAPCSQGKSVAFSSPTHVVEMQQQWQDKAIHHDETWAKDADLAITLDQHLYPALSPLINRFAEEKGLNIKLQEGTCGISAGLLSKKHVDIGGFCCPPGDMDRLPGLQYHTLGISALGILVNARNTSQDLDINVIRDLFRGEVRNWSRLTPGKEKQFDEPVKVIARFHCKQRPGHWRLILDNDELFSLRTQEVGSIEDMIKKIADLPGALGYEVLWNIERYKATEKVKFLRVGGADPTILADVATGRYPFYRVYNITTWQQGNTMVNKQAMALVNYLLAHIEEVKSEFELITATKLRQSGWKFTGNELIGEPGPEIKP